MEDGKNKTKLKINIEENGKISSWSNAGSSSKKWSAAHLPIML